MATAELDSTQDAQENEALILDMLERFLKSEVKPYVHALEAADEYPHESGSKLAIWDCEGSK
jgi:hypothetical protein